LPKAGVWGIPDRSLATELEYGHAEAAHGVTQPGSEPTPYPVQDRRVLEETEHRLQALEIALAAARAEADSLRARLRAFETSNFWRLTGPLRAALDGARVWRRRLSATPRSARGATVRLDYASWIKTGEAPCRAAMLPRGGAADDAVAPRLALVVQGAPGSGPALKQLLATCPKAFTILILDQDAGLAAAITGHGQVLHHPVAPGFIPADALAIALARLDADMLCFLDLRDRLAPDALALVAQSLAQNPACDLLFADEDWLGPGGRRVRPFFKPGWDAELQRGRDLVGPFAFFRTALLRQAAPTAGPAWRYDLANQIAAATEADRIRHMPAVLCHRVLPEDAPSIRAAAEAQLQRDGVAARVEPAGPDGNRVLYALPDPAPLVSVIVPMRDRADLLRVCAESVLQRTLYPHLELLIVDNGSVEPEALALLDALTADARVRVLRQPGAFNWSALNNAAAARAAEQRYRRATPGLAERVGRPRPAAGNWRRGTEAALPGWNGPACRANDG
jgi:hypothetical protein